MLLRCVRLAWGSDPRLLVAPLTLYLEQYFGSDSAVEQNGYPLGILSLCALHFAARARVPTALICIEVCWSAFAAASSVCGGVSLGL